MADERKQYISDSIRTIPDFPKKVVFPRVLTKLFASRCGLGCGLVRSPYQITPGVVEKPQLALSMKGWYRAYCSKT